VVRTRSEWLHAMSPAQNRQGLIPNDAMKRAELRGASQSIGPCDIGLNRVGFVSTNLGAIQHYTDATHVKA
jgi:hypothetical protein